MVKSSMLDNIVSRMVQFTFRLSFSVDEEVVLGSAQDIFVTGQFRHPLIVLADVATLSEETKQTSTQNVIQGVW